MGQAQIKKKKKSQWSLRENPESSQVYTVLLVQGVTFMYKESSLQKK